jgi:hypothetical protein
MVTEICRQKLSLAEPKTEIWTLACVILNPRRTKTELSSSGKNKSGDKRWSATDGKNQSACGVLRTSLARRKTWLRRVDQGSMRTEEIEHRLANQIEQNRSQPGNRTLGHDQASAQHSWCSDRSHTGSETRRCVRRTIGLGPCALELDTSRQW